MVLSVFLGGEELMYPRKIGSKESHVKKRLREVNEHPASKKLRGRSKLRFASGLFLFNMATKYVGIVSW